MLTADYRNGFVVGREQDPAFKTMFLRQPNEKRCALIIVSRRPCKRAVREPRETGQPVIVVPQDAHRDTLATEASHEAETSIIGAGHHRAHTTRSARTRLGLHNAEVSGRQGPSVRAPAKQTSFPPQTASAAQNSGQRWRPRSGVLEASSRNLRRAADS